MCGPGETSGQGAVSVGAGPNGLQVATLTKGADVCTIAVERGHVLTWQSRGQERLFLSTKAALDAPADAKQLTAIRGGIPVCWPQFGTFGDLPKHGFARNSGDWKLAAKSIDAETGNPEVTLALKDSEYTRSLGFPAFTLEYRVVLRDGSLETGVKVTAGPEAPLSFTDVLHTYFNYRGEPLVGFEGEYEHLGGEGPVGSTASKPAAGGDFLERVYPARPQGHEVGFGDLRVRRLEGFADVVLWKLDAAGCATVGDLEPGDWERFVCVEAADALKPVQVPAGASLTRRMELAIV